jgi:hypothetical protein
MTMKTVELPIQELAVIGITRAAAGAGIALLATEKMNEEQRKTAGWILLGIGVLTTIPLAISILRKIR